MGLRGDLGVDLELAERRDVEYQNPETAKDRVVCVGMSQGACLLGHVHTFIHFRERSGKWNYWAECDLLPGPQVVHPEIEDSWVGFN